MKNKIISVINKDGATLARSDTSHRIFISGITGWDSMNGAQKDAVCRIVWAVKEGDFEIEERKAGGSGPPSVYSHRVD